MLLKDISQYHIVTEAANMLTTKVCLRILMWYPVYNNSAASAPLARYATEH